MSQLVSVLMATYNGSRFLAEQAQSILGQSHEDIELLVIDDGSSDGTPSILAQLAAEDPRVRLVPSVGNRGQKERLRSLLELARGDFISVSDQDDVWAPDKTELLLAGIEGVGLAYGRSELVDAEGGSLGTTLLESLGHEPRDDDRLTCLFQPRVSGHAMLVRREYVTESAFGRSHAYDWLIGLDALFAQGWRHVDGALVRHRIHDSNQWNGANIRRARERSAAGPLRRAAARLRRMTSTGALNLRARRRHRFLIRLEHLSHSPFVAREAQTLIGSLMDACVTTWISGSRRPGHKARMLRSRFGALEPHAGSPRDWSVAQSEFARLI